MGRRTLPLALCNGIPKSEPRDFGSRGLRSAATQQTKGKAEVLRRLGNALGKDFALVGLAQHVAAPPDGLDVILAAGRDRKLLAQLADENVDDLEFGLVHAAIEMVEEHLLGERRPLAQGEQLEHLVFLAGQVHALAGDLYGLGVEVHSQIASLDDRLRMALAAADDGMDASDQLVLVEGLGHVVVGAEAETAHLVFDAGETAQDEDWGLHLGDAQGAEHLVAAHVGQVQVKQDDVVVIELAEIDALFAEVRRVHVETFGFEHQLDALRRRAVVLNQEHTHAVPLKVVPAGTWGNGGRAVTPNRSLLDMTQT